MFNTLKIKDILKIPFHPILFSSYPILYLVSKNIGIINPDEFLRSITLSVLVCILFFICFTLILKNADKSALICSIFFILFFSFGHTIRLLSNTSIEYLEFDLILLWSISFIMLTLLFLKIKNPLPFSIMLNSTGLFLMVIPLINIFWFSLSNLSSKTDYSAYLSSIRGDVAATRFTTQLQPKNSPDIYYIILDMYERADKLQEYYGFDNHAFVQALQERGFYVADQSRSNYLSTYYSIPSSMNLVYLNQLPPALLKKMTTSLKTNYVHDFVKTQGYQAVQFQSGDWVTDDFNADITMPSSVKGQHQSHFNLFEALLSQTTLLHAAINIKTPFDNDNNGMESLPIIDDNFDMDRSRINDTFSHLSDFASKDEKYFIFAHILSPHPPYIFGPHGEKVNTDASEYLLLDRKKSYMGPYTDQLQYINYLVLNTIDRILATSKTPPIIILQSDHGHGMSLDWNAPNKTDLDIRSANLTAIYYPDQSYATLYSSISPVNIFRLVFNHTFGTKFTLLPDTTFFHAPPTPNDTQVVFTNTCTQYFLCNPDKFEEARTKSLIPNSNP